MGFSRQDYWSGLPFPLPGDLPNPGIKPESLVSPALATGFFTTAPPGKPNQNIPCLKNLWHFSLPTEKTPNLEAIQSPPHGSKSSPDCYFASGHVIHFPSCLPQCLSPFCLLRLGLPAPHFIHEKCPSFPSNSSWKPTRSLFLVFSLLHTQGHAVPTAWY